MTLRNSGFFPINCTVSVQLTAYNSTQPLDRATATRTTTRTFRAYLKRIGGSGSGDRNSKSQGVGLPEQRLQGWPENTGDTTTLQPRQDVTVSFDDGEVYKGRFYKREHGNTVIGMAIGGNSEELIVDVSDQRR